MNLEESSILNLDKNIWEKVMSSIDKSSFEFGAYFSYQVRHDIRHLLCTFSRYKFAAQMVGTKARSVLELGCNEGIGTLFFDQNGSKVRAVDFDENAVSWAKEALSFSNIDFECSDFIGKKFGDFDAVVSLDVIEHISSDKEMDFLNSVLMNLKSNGFAIIGTPNICASAHASEASKIGHINLYDHKRLEDLLLRGFENVFLFGMNDEVLHTGFPAMCHYIFALACNKR